MFTYKSLDEVYDIDGVSPAITTVSQGGHRQPKILEKYRVSGNLHQENMPDYRASQNRMNKLFQTVNFINRWGTQ
jgi:hypothetical protein